MLVVAEHPAVLTSHHQTITWLVLWKKFMRTAFFQWRGTANHYMQVTAEAGCNACSCSEVEENFW